jgi:hypothetical protein
VHTADNELMIPSLFWSWSEATDIGHFDIGTGEPLGVRGLGEEIDEVGTAGSKFGYKSIKLAK